MPMTLDDRTHGDVVVLRASGTLEKADYDRTKPDLDRIAKTRGRVRLLCELRDFDSWTIGGLWQDVKFGGSPVIVRRTGFVRQHDNIDW